MGSPLKIGGRAERYSRVKDKKAFNDNFEAIFGKREISRQSGRTTIMYQDGKAVVLRDHSKWVAPPGVKDPTVAAKQLAGGISAYDYFIAQQHDGKKKRDVPVPKALFDDSNSPKSK